jgi:hypothetical protein
LTWHQRGSTITVGGNSEEICEFYAIASSAINAGDVISDGESGQSSHDTVLIAFGITGASTSAPFDTHTGLPESNTGTSGTPNVAAFSTSNANDLIIGMTGYTGTSTNETAASGYTLIASQTYSTSQVWCAAEYEVVSTTSIPKVTWGTTISSSDWVMIVDAVQRAW